MENVDIEALRNEFESKKKLQEEFSTFENYLSYIQVGAGEFIADPAECLSFSLSDANIAVETPAAVKFDEATSGDKQLEEHFGKSQQVQNEFGDAASYCAFVHAQRWRAERANRLSDRSGETGDFDEIGATDDQLREHFAQTQQVQDEFGDVGSYLAYAFYQGKQREREERLSERHRRKTFRAQRQELAAKS